MKKRSKKLLCPGARVAATHAPGSRSFLVLFFKKELLACCALASSPICFAQPIGNTSYETLPFVSTIYRPCWNCAVNFDPAQLFFSANPRSPFLDESLMARVRAASAAQSAAGIVPTAGLQRWEDTYALSFPEGSFANEPAAIKADRKALDLSKLPEFVAWRDFVTGHPQYADVAFDGGTMPPQPGYFRSWGAQWGYISPLTPLDQADCPPDRTGGCTWGDAFAYRYAQTSLRTGGYGLQLSDFTDGQPYPDTLHDFNPRIVAAFAKTQPAGPVPGGQVSAQAAWINHHAFSAWTDFLDQGYAYFYSRLAAETGEAVDHPALVIDQCSISPSFRRLEGVDERFIAAAISPDNFMCIWDDQIIQAGRSGPFVNPPIGELAGGVLASAREPKLRNGSNIEADDPAYWKAITAFYPGLPDATRQELGLKLLKRLWVWSAWAHVADRAGKVRRALAFACRDYWDTGTLDRLGPAARLIHSIVPARPFGAALYYSVAVERAVEAASAARVPAGAIPTPYLMPNDLASLLDSGAPVGYYVSDAALPALSADAGDLPSAWVVLDAAQAMPAKELAALKALAPVVRSAAALASLPGQPLALPRNAAGFGFWAKNGRLIVVVSNPSAAADAVGLAGEVQIAWLRGKTAHVKELQSGAQSVLPAVKGQIRWPVHLSRWDTLIFEVSP